MNQCIFICDKQWNIEEILDTTWDLPVEEEKTLTDLITEPGILENSDDFELHKQNVKMLHFHEEEQDIPAIICTFPKGYLIFLVRIQSQEDFLNFTSSYMKCLAWADKNLQALYSDEYYHIQQMNNQLLNSQRALIKCNHRLKQVLDEIGKANNTIALLEQDKLTDLYCASAFYRNAQKCLEEHSDMDYDIIVLDIRNFRILNEIFGRKTADGLLQALAVFLQGLDVTESGIFARIPADIFYILIPQELHFYEVIEEKVSAFFRTYPLPFHLQAQVSVYPVDNRKMSNRKISIEQMCDRAKMAFNTKNFQNEIDIIFYNQSLHEKLISQNKLLDSVHSAIENKEFQLYLQSKVNMNTGEVIGAEALIRWIHPKIGFISPGEFIPLFEKEGYIYEVDKYIWEEACKVLKARKDKGKKELPISVNVARGDFYEEDLCEFLTGLIQNYELKPEQLHLEVIERAYVTDSDNIFRVLTELREKGFCIEMDDFGIGESSLSMLAEMPVNVLKLDRQFLVKGLDDKRHIEVIRCIINLAKVLDINIIAEGVETQEQADLLLSMGCTCAQGFFYAKPEPGGYFREI